MALRLRLLGGLFLALITAVPTYGAVTVSTAFNSTTNYAGITAWPITPTVDTTAAAGSPGAFLVNNIEGNWGDAFVGFGLSQSFVATTDGKLANVQIAVTGNISTAPTFQMNVYEALGTADFTDISCYDPDANMSCDAYTPNSTDLSANLLTDTSQHAWGQYTLEGANAAVLNMTLTGADQINIVNGKTYIVEFTLQTAPSDTILWGRMANNAFNYANGQAFRSRTPLNGNNMRDLAMAVTIAPNGTPGDFEGDGDVDGRDFLIWQRNPSVGNLSDWQTNYGTTGPLVAATAVPEPGSLILLGGCLLGSALIRRR